MMRLISRSLTTACIASAIIALASFGQPSFASAQDDDDDDEQVEEGSGGGGGEGSGRRRRSNARNWDINQPHTGGRPFQLDAHVGFAWFGLGFATGLRFGIPLMNNGFISSLNNAVYLNFGIDFYFVRCDGGGGGRCNYGFGMGFPVALHWEFYFNEHWSVFVEAGAQFFMHPRFFDGDNFGVYEGQYWLVAAVGGTYRFNENIGILVRLGIPYAVAALLLEFG